MPRCLSNGPASLSEDGKPPKERRRETDPLSQHTGLILYSFISLSNDLIIP
ncbi:mCG1051119 [Mus musculus]|nr:mCG1051119 [Mus musculus]